MTNAIQLNSLAAINAATGATGRASLNQADFLRLLTTQLQTQDPFAPMDTASMVSQMSQLSNNTGIAEMNASLRAIAAQLGTTSAAGRLDNAAGWIGHRALIAADFVNRAADGSYAGQINLDSPADRVTIDLLDSQGLIVHTETVDAPDGVVPFSWNGVGEGGPVTGPLRVRASARSEGRTVPTTTNVWTPITAVQSPAGGAAQRLVTPNGLIAPEAAIRLG